MSVIFWQIGRIWRILILHTNIHQKIWVKIGLKSIKLESKQWFSSGKWEKNRWYVTLVSSSYPCKNGTEAVLVSSQFGKCLTWCGNMRKTNRAHKSEICSPLRACFPRLNPASLWLAPRIGFAYPHSRSSLHRERVGDEVDDLSWANS